VSRHRRVDLGPWIVGWKVEQNVEWMAEWMAEWMVERVGRPRRSHVVADSEAPPPSRRCTYRL
jgi:hypothetical protein